MQFLELRPRRERGALVFHAMILSVAALSLAVFRLADDEVRGKALVSDAYGFTLVFVAAGYYLGWLPEIWRKTGGTAFEPLVMPSFIAMVVAYLYFTFRSHFIQPAATGAAVGLQLLALIILSCRNE
jgi:hypothetical protein